MFAFVTTLGKLLKLNTENDAPNNFDQLKRLMVIPLYQREYKWPDDKIRGLITDINSRDKFLGNIIMDELDNHYEIADGQQRITTCFLILVCLYNHFRGSPLEQESIKQFIMPLNGQPILQNDSIGEFISENDGHFSLSIHDEQDCYCQKSDFIRVFSLIESSISFIANTGNIQAFKNKLLDCELLILINNRHTNSNPIEQVFLDINEKAKLLDPEDIFKGHCFEKYSEEYYSRLKAKWVELKKIAVSFSKFGFKDLSEFLYLFILETETADITSVISKDLTINGRHFLDNKTMDQIDSLLQNMIQFGTAAISLCDNIEKESYRFVNICPDSERFKNTGDHLVLKRMFSDMLLYSDAIYQKLPLFFLLYKLYADEELRQIVDHDALKRTVTNLYIYNFVFAFLSNQKKSKKLIDHTLRDILCSDSRSAQEIIRAAKELRIAQVEQAVFNDSFKRPKTFFVDSIIDFYEAQSNWMKNIYFDSPMCSSNIEHFIIPDDSRRRVTWVGSDGNTFDMIIPKDLVTQNKKTQANYIVIDRVLNMQIGRKDIVQKISEIEGWYSSRGQAIPNHIQLQINHIKSCGKFDELVALKADNAQQQDVQPVYFEFIREYFGDEKLNMLYQSILQRFKDAFCN